MSWTVKSEDGIHLSVLRICTVQPTDRPFICTLKCTDLIVFIENN